MSQPVTAYLSLGSNVGDRMLHLRRALGLLASTPGITVLRTARVYETEPVGVRDQPWFLNTVVQVSTRLAPRDLLSVAKGVERRVGRSPTFRWGPREIDVDILLYDDIRLADDQLTLPHPRMHERLFVLLPLRDLCPHWKDERGRGIDQLIEGLRETAEVRPYPEALTA
mgnify:CR=1 FL=1